MVDNKVGVLYHWERRRATTMPNCWIATCKKDALYNNCQQLLAIEQARRQLTTEATRFNDTVYARSNVR